MKFSIATPVFNGMPALRRCIGSVRGQTTAEPLKSSNELNKTAPVVIQHIVQDGGSADGAVEFLEKYCEGVSNQVSGVNPLYAFCYASERDAGMYDAINKAWAKADGDILSWLNSDEQVLPGTLEKVADYFETHPEVDAVFGNTIITTETGEPYAARREIPLRKRYVANGFLYALSCSTFYRRSLWDTGLLPLDTQYRYSADADLVLRLLSAGVRFGHMDDFLALFGVEEGRNLSFLPEMAVETEEIQRKYGSFSAASARKVVMMFRYAERLLKGCYRPVAVNYGYALDEVPNYEACGHPRLGFRFTYGKFSKESGANA